MKEKKTHWRPEKQGKKKKTNAHKGARRNVKQELREWM